MNVYNKFKDKYNVDLGFIMGDFNYGGSYVRKDKLDIDNPPFRGLINTGTSVKTSKPYDRIYVAPKETPINAAGVDKYSGTLNELEYYKTVSDHYPVYVDVDIGNTKSGGTKPPG